MSIRTSPFFTGVASSAAVTAGVTLMLYTGQGFLRTAGLLLCVTLGAITAGLWAGDDSSASTRPRAMTLMGTLLVASVFASAWTVRPELRERAYGGSLAVLLILALPAYAIGAMYASLHRHREPGERVGVAALGGAALGVFLATSLLIPRLDAWGVMFAAAALMIPTAILPSSRDARDTIGGAMRDHVVIITGVDSTGQLGFAIAQKFASAGARVIITGLTDGVRGIANQLGERERIAGIRADLTRSEDITGVITAAESFGRLDVLVNVAGGLSVIKPIEDTSPEDFQREISRNAETVLRMSRAALPLLRASHGAIVNFASPAAETGASRLGAYSASKAAVLALTRTLALEEAANGVRVNAIAPGMVDTEQNRASAAAGTAFVSREQVVEAVYFLASDSGSGVSGETLHVLGSTLK